MAYAGHLWSLVCAASILLVLVQQSGSLCHGCLPRSCAVCCSSMDAARGLGCYHEECQSEVGKLPGFQGEHECQSRQGQLRTGPCGMLECHFIHIGRAI